MCRWIWRRLFAVAAGVIVLAGTASAQNASQPPPASTTPPPIAAAQPAPGPTTPSVPAASAGLPASPGPGAVIVSGNCGGVGTTPNGGRIANGALAQRWTWANGGYFCSGCQYGATCNSGCGSFRADMGFVFGSCKSFFSPCGPGVCPGIHGYRNGNGKCGSMPVLGTGSQVPFNPCVYDSYANH